MGEDAARNCVEVAVRIATAMAEAAEGRVPGRVSDLHGKRLRNGRSLSSAFIEALANAPASEVAEAILERSDAEMGLLWKAVAIGEPEPARFPVPDSVPLEAAAEILTRLVDEAVSGREELAEVSWWSHQ